MDELAVDKILEKAGIKDFDDLRDFEKESYFRMLEIAESGKITLELVAKEIRKMREKVEFALVTESLPVAKDLFLKARLKNYILLESFFDRPARAKEMLEQYGKPGGKPI